jgi:hypothetical protein
VVLDLSMEEASTATTIFTQGSSSRISCRTYGLIFAESRIDFMRDKGIDYFENSRRATHVQQEYAIANPLKFNGYGPSCWGITASDGPGPDLHQDRRCRAAVF